jgi:hypothetical protein
MEVDDVYVLSDCNFVEGGVTQLSFLQIEVLFFQKPEDFMNHLKP